MQKPAAFVRMLQGNNNPEHDLSEASEAFTQALGRRLQAGAGVLSKLISALRAVGRIKDGYRIPCGPVLRFVSSSS